MKENTNHCVFEVQISDRNGNSGIITKEITIQNGSYTGIYQYNINKNSPENGTVNVRENATEGQIVEITATPDEAYEPTSVEVMTDSGKIVEIEDKGNYTYTFTMPSEDVTVTVIFTEQTSPSP